MVSLSLFIASVAVFGLAFIHFGCAAIVAHSAQCMSNIKALAMGESMYSQDYDDRFPPSTCWSEVISTRVKRAAASHSVADGDPFRCPAAETPASYGMNALLSGIDLSRIDAPANTVLFFDADAPTRSFAGGAREVARSRHSDRPNVAFVDGHAKGVNAFGFEELNWSPAEERLPTQDRQHKGPSIKGGPAITGPTR